MKKKCTIICNMKPLVEPDRLILEEREVKANKNFKIILEIPLRGSFKR